MSQSPAYVFLNGRFVPRGEAKVDIEDRGLLFGDGVYEVVRCYGGRALAMAAHLDRLQRSMAAIELPPASDALRLDAVTAELLDRNRLTDARVYWQVTRGCAPRSHLPPAGITPTVLATAQPLGPIDPRAPLPTAAAITHPDERWHRCDVKSLMLLPNVLARMKAARAGAEEAILHRGDIVTEGSSTSVFLVRGGELHTHPANQWILAGITRQIVLELARPLGLKVHERAFTLDELRQAEEIFVAGTTAHLTAITRLDGRPLPGPQPGPVSARVHHAFLGHLMHECGLAG